MTDDGSEILFGSVRNEYEVVRKRRIKHGRLIGVECNECLVRSNGNSRIHGCGGIADLYKRKVPLMRPINGVHCVVDRRVDDRECAGCFSGPPLFRDAERSRMVFLNSLEGYCVPTQNGVIQEVFRRYRRNRKYGRRTGNLYCENKTEKPFIRLLCAHKGAILYIIFYICQFYTKLFI